MRRNVLWIPQSNNAQMAISESASPLKDPPKVARHPIIGEKPENMSQVAVISTTS